jgi:SAM-dependent methyltransferase
VSVFTLADIVPWGRGFDEYRAMFALSEADLSGRILGCGDGPAGFNAEATRRGAHVVSVDPLYASERADIAERIDVTFDDMLAETRRNAREFVWTTIRSVDELGETRRTAMQGFLNDYDAGRAAGRYVEGALPRLPFEDGSFDLALSGHFLFLYSAHRDLDFHLASLREMCRVAREARVFPLLALGGSPSPFVEPCRDALAGAGYEVTIETVPYEFQRGGNRAMRVRCAPTDIGT